MRALRPFLCLFLLLCSAVPAAAQWAPISPLNGAAWRGGGQPTGAAWSRSNVQFEQALLTSSRRPGFKGPAWWVDATMTKGPAWWVDATTTKGPAWWADATMTKGPAWWVDATTTKGPAWWADATTTKGPAWWADATTTKGPAWWADATMAKGPAWWADATMTKGPAWWADASKDREGLSRGPAWWADATTTKGPAWEDLNAPSGIGDPGWEKGNASPMPSLMAEQHVVVPEPATIILLVTGLLALAPVAYFRRKGA